MQFHTCILCGKGKYNNHLPKGWAIEIGSQRAIELTGSKLEAVKLCGECRTHKKDKQHD